MGLFDKKECSICGGSIGMLGNRKLDDGNMCKDCAAKLSPWFTGRRHSTVADIKQQLEYREQNKAAVASFNTTRVYGVNTKLYLDDNAGKFIVTRSTNWQKDNPDVLDFSQISMCDTSVDEDRDEIKYRDSQGKQVSYVPPRYRYSYDFDIIINVNHPYIDTIKFQLNPSSVVVEPNAGMGGFNNNTLGGMIGNALNSAMSGNYGGMNAEYQQYSSMAQEIKMVLTQASQGVRGGQMGGMMGNQMGMNQGFNNQMGNQMGMNQGFNQMGNQMGMNQGFNNQMGMNQGFNQMGNQMGMNQGFNQMGNQMGMNNGFNNQMGNQMGMNQGFNNQMGGQMGMNQGFNNQMGSQMGMNQGFGTAAMGGAAMGAAAMGATMSGGMVVCKLCGARTTPDANGICEFCGGPAV